MNLTSIVPAKSFLKVVLLVDFAADRAILLLFNTFYMLLVKVPTSTLSTKCNLVVSSCLCFVLVPSRIRY